MIPGTILGIMAQGGVVGIIAPGTIRHGIVLDITIITGIIAIIILIMEDTITNIIIHTITAGALIIPMGGLLMGAGLLRWDAVRGELLPRGGHRLIIQAVHLFVLPVYPPVYLPVGVLGVNQ
jgi:hypothetical protein